MSDLAGSNMDYIKKTVGIANLHYPERSYVIYVVNAPFYASLGWKLIKPLVHENTQKKVKILSASETLKGLQEHIDISQIPEFYGGQLDYGGHDSCRFNSPDVLAMDEYVRKLNGEEGEAQNNVPFARAAASSDAEDNLNTAAPAPPGEAGEAVPEDDRAEAPRVVYRRASAVLRPPGVVDASSPAPSDGGE